MTVSGYDDLAICNASLNMIGADPIQSLITPTSDNEATCARLFPILVASLMTHPWKFNKAVRQLSRNADMPGNFGFDYAYKLPSDLTAGPLAVFADGDTSDPISDYFIANDHIYSSEERIDILYRSSGSDPEIWPGYFIALFVTAFSSMLAVPVKSDGEQATEKRIQAFGSADQKGKGGLWAQAATADALTGPMNSLFRNGDPLSATRR